MGLFKADLFYTSVPGMWHCNKRPGAVAPVCVYTSDSKGSNRQVKMRQLILPGREQPMHRPERVMSNGEACFKQVAWGLSGMVSCCHQTTSFQTDMLRDSLLMTVDFACAGEEWVSDRERIASNSHASTSTLYVSDVTPSSTTRHPGSYTGPSFEGAYSPSRICSPQYIAACYYHGLSDCMDCHLEQQAHSCVHCNRYSLPLCRVAESQGCCARF